MFPVFVFVCLFVFLLSYLSLGTRRQAMSAMQMKRTKKFSAHQSVMATDHGPIGQRINLIQAFIPEAFSMTNHFCSSRKVFSIYFRKYLELTAFREYLYYFFFPGTDWWLDLGSHARWTDTPSLSYTPGLDGCFISRTLRLILLRPSFMEPQLIWSSWSPCLHLPPPHVLRMFKCNTCW